MKLDLQNLTDAAGNAVDTSKLGEGMDVILTAIAHQIPDPLDQDAIGDLVKAQVKAATEPLTEQIAELTNKLTHAKPPKKKEGEGDDDGPLGTLTDLVSELKDEITELKTSRDTERAQATTREVATTFVESTYPNLKAKEQLTARLVSAGVTNEDEAKAAAKDVLAEWEAAGVDVDAQISASSEGEGGKPKGDSDAETRKQDRINKIQGRVKSPA